MTPPSPLDESSTTSSSSRNSTDSLTVFLLLPTVAMSLGWALRGTIGGGPIGALIPGAIVTLCLCCLLGLNRSLGIVAAIGTVGIGLGGQETYGQTIGFLRDSSTVLWGLAGLTIKGAMWGLSGGVLVGLGFMHAKYRPREIMVGVALMCLGTVLGRMLIDEPRLAYFSNRLDKPREEVWVGITVGALFLSGYLLVLRREWVSLLFACGGLLAGGAGFGGGGLFIALGMQLPASYRGWPWWKMMEFTFGALYGLGLGALGYFLRHSLRKADREPAAYERPDVLRSLPVLALIAVGLAVAVGAVWLNFTIPYRAAFTFVAAGLILMAVQSNRLAWHIALSMTICGFFRDFLHRGVEQEWLGAWFDSWLAVAITTLPIVAIVAVLEQRKRLSPTGAVLGLMWLATLFGVIKLGVPQEGSERLFVPALFIVELLVATALLWLIRPNRDAVASQPAVSNS